MKINVRILIAVVFIFFISIYFLFTHYLGTSENHRLEKIANSELLLKSGKHTNAHYDDKYTTFKKNSTNPTKYISYSFTANDKEYTDSKQILEIPTEPTFDLIYLPSNPDIHSENPAKDLQYWQSQKKDDSIPFVTWFIFILTGAILYNTFYKIYKHRKA